LGDYDVNVLEYALSQHNLTTRWFNKVKESVEDLSHEIMGDSMVIGVLMNMRYKGFWN
jgi:hypothetical protein